MQKRAFIIHLARAKGRKRFADELVRSSPIETEIIDGVDGGKLEQDEIDRVYSPGLHRPHYPFRLRPAEIGCFLSHRRCWRRIVDDELDYGLVFEDDAALDAAVAGPAIDFAESHIADAGYIQMPVRDVPAGAELNFESAGIRLMSPLVTPLRTSGQVVSQAAARRLLYVTEVFDRPIDTLLQMHWITGIRPLVLTPSGLTNHTEAAGGSTIASGKTVFERVNREIRRFSYRRKIEKLSRRHQAPA
ncbi:glycosyltransferase family 25 protein [Nitratireductor sp. XY-223]|uniref:glycosyltransferase family 25 protein n=1 Tax=Nitratireductor sp. XY-223 TaxID=2561926 RepID=UPI0010AB0941|nr:glycosyltransferase family 25 protein [Nitratireductor sp. XY-223]